MPYEWVEDGVTSDATFRAFGTDLDELFTAAADATTGLMVAEPETLAPAVTVPVTVTAPSLDLLLLRFLEELVFEKDAHHLLLRATAVRVQAAGSDGEARAEALLRGETIDPSKHALATDVKAVTLHGLRVERAGDHWEAQVTLDV